MINIVVLVGRAGKDAESRATPKGKIVSNFSLATDLGFGENKKTEWSDIVAWDKLGENVVKFVKKGTLLCVIGRKETRSWEKDGQKHYRTEIIATDVQKLDTREGGGSGSGSAPTQSRQTAPVAKATPVPQPVAAPAFSGGFDDDDIPF